jgi:O-antigen/teichoic acid export membrane protein
VILRDPLADLAGVHESWAAACLAPAPALWLAVSLHRGALQGAGAHAAVGGSLLVEGVTRVGIAVALVAAGAGVTGAVLAGPLSALAVLAHLALRARRAFGEAGDARPAPVGRSLRGAWVPVAALALLAAIQQLDVIVARHRLGAAASSYIAAAVASKVVVWAAAGLALALLPEVSRQVRAGIAGPGRLARTLVLVLAIASPLAIVCVVAAGPLLRLVFGPHLAGGADALPWLAVAMSLFACAFVAVQHALALQHRGVLGLLAVVAVAEPLALTRAGTGPVDLAGAVVALQLVLALAAIAIGIRTAAPRAEAPA